MTSEYTGIIGVGTSRAGGPAFEARVVFDTGSTNLWVASVLCTASSCPSNRIERLYDPAKSTSQEPYWLGGSSAGEDIDIMFGTGELRGPLHVDTYRVGPMVVERQPFAMIREMSGEVFETFPFEGILGLGFRSLSFAGIEPFFDRVIQQKLLENNEFAFYLNGDTTQPSALLWGGVDKDLYDPPIRMFPVVQAHYWALELVDLWLGNVSLAALALGSQRPRRVIIDSGTTFFTAPSAVYGELSARMPEAKCGMLDGHAPLRYVLRTTRGRPFELVVTQETYMIGDAWGETCRPALMRLDVNKRYGPAMILGEVFMRHFFTVFSRGDGSSGQARVGIARARFGRQPKLPSRTLAAPKQVMRHVKT